jgi:hypothetical protein
MFTLGFSFGIVIFPITGAYLTSYSATGARQFSM